MDLDDDLSPLLAQVLAVRDERLSTLRMDGTRVPYFWYDHTCPVVRDGLVVDNGCPLDRSGGLALGLGYEWGTDQQAAAEQVIGTRLDLGRWDGLVAEVRSHWPNVSSSWGDDTIPWLEGIAPGLWPLLDDLGRTEQFRRLRHYTPYYGERSQLTRPVVVGDPRVEHERPERREYRANLIAARAMTHWYSARYADEPWARQECPLCGDWFWPNALDGIDLARAGLPRYCAPCVAMMRRDAWGLHLVADADLPGALVSVVRHFQQRTGVFPAQGIKATTIGDLPAPERDTWAALLMLMPGADTAKSVFGSWRGLLNEAGLLDGRTRSGQSGYVTFANDGHLALSIGERVVCDWLHANGIAHDKEPMYPSHPDLNPGGRLRADWLIGDCWVELAGRMDDTAYARTMARKQELARTLGLRHLVLLPPEVNRLSALAAEHWGYDASAQAQVRGSREGRVREAGDRP